MQQIIPGVAFILAIFVVSVFHILTPMGVLVLFLGLGWVINSIVVYVLQKQHTELEEKWLSLRWP